MPLPYQHHRILIQIYYNRRKCGWQGKILMVFHGVHETAGRKRPVRIFRSSSADGPTAGRRARYANRRQKMTVSSLSLVHLF